MIHFQQMIARSAMTPDSASPLLAGDSTVAQSMRQLVTLAAGSMDAVLIKGTAGSGKRALAQAIHAASPHRHGLFIDATGADFDLNYLQERQEGTLHLRNVMHLPVPIQHKLLLWLDSEPALYMRLIATSDAHDDSDRIIAPLRARLERLYIPCPPLSQRRDDIAAMIAAHWDADGNHAPPIMDAQGWDALREHSWPGNYRALSAFSAKAKHIYGGVPMTATHIRRLLDGKTVAAAKPMPFNLKQHLAQEEKRFLAAALMQCNGIVAAAAARSGLKRTTFLAKMKRYGLARF
jgi:DNA-binding NtrC family response regulator